MNTKAPTSPRRGRCFQAHQKFSLVWPYAAALLILVDQVSDIALGIEYMLNEDYAWGTLTLIFACVSPLLQGLFVTLTRGRSTKSVRIDSEEVSLAVAFVHAVALGGILTCTWLNNRKKYLSMVLTCPLLAPWAIFGAVAAIGIFPLLLLLEGLFLPLFQAVQYHKHPERRNELDQEVLEASLLELITEAIPQLLLQVYIYASTDALSELSTLQTLSICMSYLMVVKGLVMGDVELYRGKDREFSFTPVLGLVALFRLVDVLAGVLSLAVIIVVLRGYIFLAYLIGAFQLAFLVYIFFMFAPMHVGRKIYRDLQAIMKKQRESRRCPLTCGCVCYAVLLFGIGVPLLVSLPLSLIVCLSHLIPACIVKCFGCGNHQPVVTSRSKWEIKSGLAIVSFADSVFLYLYWTVLFGPSFMLRLRGMTRPIQNSLQETANELHRSKRLNWFQFDAYPTFSMHLLVLLAGGVLSWLIEHGSLATDYDGTPLTETTQQLSSVVVYVAAVSIVMSCFFLTIDRSVCGHRLIRRFAPTLAP